MCFMTIPRQKFVHMHISVLRLCATMRHWALSSKECKQAISLFTTTTKESTALLGPLFPPAEHPTTFGRRPVRPPAIVS